MLYEVITPVVVANANVVMTPATVYVFSKDISPAVEPAGDAVGITVGVTRVT